MEPGAKPDAGKSKGKKNDDEQKSEEENRKPKS